MHTRGLPPAPPSGTRPPRTGVGIYDKTVAELYKEFLETLEPGQTFGATDAIAWFKEHYPKVREGTARAQLTSLTTNVPARLNYSTGNVPDLFFRLDRGRYRAYDPERDPAPIRSAVTSGAATTLSPERSTWIFQANPDHFNLRDALAELTEVTWSVRKYAKRITPGDQVFLWESGKDGGLLARAEVLAGPEVMELPDDEQEFVLGGGVDEKAVRVRLGIRQVRDEPVDRETLRSNPRLVGLLLLRAPQGTVFPVAPGEAKALLELLAGQAPPRVVKIEPGEDARYWPECRDGGYACTTWDAVGDLGQYDDFDHFREAFAKKYLDQYQGSEGTVTKKAKELWTLRELRPGDIVVANRGINEILGIGTVVEPGYAFREDRPEWRHTVAVEWTDTEPRTIPKQQPWEVTRVADVPLDLYKGIVSHQPATKTDRPRGTQATIGLRAGGREGPGRRAHLQRRAPVHLPPGPPDQTVRHPEWHLRHREDPARHGRRRGPRRGAASHHPSRGGARRRLPAHRLPLHAAVQPLHPAQAPAGDRDPATGERPGGASGGRGDLPQGPAAAAPEPGWRQRHGRPPPRRGEPVVPLGAERGGRVLHRRGERGGRRSPHHRRAQGRPAQDRAQRDLGRHPRPPGLDRRPWAAWLLQPHPAAVRLHAVP